MPDTTQIKASPEPEVWSRVVLVGVKPQVDGGRWPIKRTLGEAVEVEASFIVDGHEKLTVELLHRFGEGDESVVPMKLRYNDEYHASFQASELGPYSYKVRAWLDQFGTWQELFRRRVEGGAEQDELKVELREGASLIDKTAAHASGEEQKMLKAYARSLKSGDVETALQEGVAQLVHRHDPREGMVESNWLPMVVEPELARFCAWYEFFPRSAADEPGRHGTLDDAAERLPRIKELGFDIVYLPPVHPIGTAFRKGKDNAPVAEKGEPGSPWAIGGDAGNGKAGGHKSVHPDLGGMEAFDRFVDRADNLGLKVAIDIAFQTSPDHPYVKEHPEWFRHRPDGSIRYAENPPKKYQDVYPFDFESKDWRELWSELKSVFEFWIGHGVRVFRVDNPHTKPFAFWEWCLRELRAQHPDLIFLAEAFSRPKIMYMLAKLGFNQSYTYFTWRNSRHELEEYCTELFHTEVAEFYRPNFWPNTPDILHDYLVHGGRPAHITRLVLAATLSSCYGIYGPPYEHLANQQHPKREEYANNEKYEIRVWNWNDPRSLQPVMKRINRIRRENPALHYMRNIRFLQADNPQIIAYVKETPDNLIVVVANLDPHHSQSGWITLPLRDLGIQEDMPYEVQDLLGGEWYSWHGPSNYVRLDPHVLPAHILRIQRHVSSERDFPYYA